MAGGDGVTTAPRATVRDVSPAGSVGVRYARRPVGHVAPGGVAGARDINAIPGA
jgi:hypothetical protein